MSSLTLNFHLVQDKEFIVSAIQRAYSDVEVMKDEEKAAEFLEKIVQVSSCGEQTDKRALHSQSEWQASVNGHQFCAQHLRTYCCCA